MLPKRIISSAAPDESWNHMHVRSPLQALNTLFVRKSLVEAQIIVTRRCNLSCGYCSEYDNVSKAIPLPVLKERIDALHRLGVIQIAMLGGEPLMHEEIDMVIRHAARKSQVSMTTNGFLLNEKLIERLNNSNLSHLQISIDSLKPTGDMYIQKSLKTIRRKLEVMLPLAKFSVHANIVLCPESKPDFKHMVSELRSLDIPVTVNLLHDERGTATICGPEYQELWDYHHEESKVISHVEHEYGRELLGGKRRSWHCRAGSRHIYVDEFGNAQYCASQRGRLEKPIVKYTRADLREQSNKRKGCEKGCAVFCVYRASQVDNDLPSLAKALMKSVRRGTVTIPLLPKRGRPPGGPSLDNSP